MTTPDYEAGALAMRVLVTGGRDFQDSWHVFAVLDAFAKEHRIETIIVGDANGVDALATQWTLLRRVHCKVFKADWLRHGKKAGPLRNQQMLEANPNVCIAFAGGHGTADMVRRCVKAGVPVRRA